MFVLKKEEKEEEEKEEEGEKEKEGGKSWKRERGMNDGNALLIRKWVNGEDCWGREGMTKDQRVLERMKKKQSIGRED